MARIVIAGASGSGTSTLAHALAGRLASQCVDAGDFFWHPVDPPFRNRRPVADRPAFLRATVLPRRDRILAGRLMGWDEGPTERLDRPGAHRLVARPIRPLRVATCGGGRTGRGAGPPVDRTRRRPAGGGAGRRRGFRP